MRGRRVLLYLAALIAITFSCLSADAYSDTNVRGILNVLRAALDLGVEVYRRSVY